MRKKLSFYAFLSLTLWCVNVASATEQEPVQTEHKQITNAEDFGFSSEQLLLLGEFLEQAGSSALLILRHGQEVYRWGAVEQKHVIHSMRKPLINALYGKYVNQGVIDIDASLADYDIDDIPPELSALERSAKVSDVLKSRSGVYHNAAANSPGMIRHRPERNTYSPGEHFFYNNWDFNLLGALLEQETGKSIFTLFLDDIAIPLGMTDYKGEFTRIDGEDPSAVIPHTDGFYQVESSKSQYPAYHFRMSARDLSKFGQLYLNMGQWDGKQIIPSDWIEKSTQAYSVINPEYGIGYGMLWNVLMKTPRREHSAFFHTGTNVHFLGVYPHSDIVIVHRVDTEKPYSFNQQDFNQLISKVWAAYADE